MVVVGDVSMLLRALKRPELACLFAMLISPGPARVHWLVSVTGLSAHTVANALKTLEALGLARHDGHRSNWLLADGFRAAILHRAVEGPGVGERPELSPPVPVDQGARPAEKRDERGSVKEPGSNPRNSHRRRNNHRGLQHHTTDQSATDGGAVNSGAINSGNANGGGVNGGDAIRDDADHSAISDSDANRDIANRSAINSSNANGGAVNGGDAIRDNANRDNAIRDNSNRGAINSGNANDGGGVNGGDAIRDNSNRSAINSDNANGGDAIRDTAIRDVANRDVINGDDNALEEEDRIKQYLTSSSSDLKAPRAQIRDPEITLPDHARAAQDGALETAQDYKPRMRRILAATQILFGETVLGPPERYPDEDLLLGSIAQAYSQRKHLRNPARVVYSNLKNEVRPGEEYLSDPMAHLPAGFLRAAGLIPDDPEDSDPQDSLADASGWEGLGGDTFGFEASEAPCLPDPSVELKIDGDGASPSDPSNGSERSACQSWQVLKSMLLIESQRSIYQRFIEPLHLASFDPSECRFYLLAADEYSRQWLEERMQRAMERMLSGICYHPARISFIV